LPLPPRGCFIGNRIECHRGFLLSLAFNRRACGDGCQCIGRDEVLDVDLLDAVQLVDDASGRLILDQLQIGILLLVYGEQFVEMVLGRRRGMVRVD
jgi:hypothetical protein